MADEITKVSMYDPSINAFREVPMDNAMLLLESALGLLEKHPQLQAKFEELGYVMPEKKDEPV